MHGGKVLGSAVIHVRAARKRGWKREAVAFLVSL